MAILKRLSDADFRNPAFEVNRLTLRSPPLDATFASQDLCAFTTSGAVAKILETIIEEIINDVIDTVARSMQHSGV